MVHRIACLIVILGLFLSSCSQATVQATPTFIPTGLLTPYQTVTPIPILPTATIRVTIPVTPAPTPTPYLYTVKNGDTMLGIAYKFGVSLEDLQAANPKVEPHFMSDGMQLIIPIDAEVPEVLPTPTPMQMHAERPRCYPSGDGGAWCIVALKNEKETSLENLSVWIGLYDLQGENFASQVAYAPLNILRPGSTMPLMAYFSPPLPDDFQAKSEVLSGLAVASNDTRYLDLQVKADQVEINQDGKQAAIQGEVVLQENEPTPTQLWVLAVAYDTNGDIVGVRKWKSAGETSFEITAYSMAGLIDHVEVLTEGRP